MKVGDYCKRGAVTVETDADIVEVCKLMRDQHLGFLVVVDPADPHKRPVGVLTDRDIVLQVCAKEVDPHTVTAADVMSRDPLTAREDDDFNELLQGMRLAGIRRVPVLNASGVLVGVIALDDALDVVAGLICDMCGSVRNEVRQERRLRST
jgi:predicted transcriptional regulator